MCRRILGRGLRGISITALLLVLAMLTPALPAATRSQKREAKALYDAGRYAEARGDRMSAYLLYTRAGTLVPDNRQYAKQKEFFQSFISQSAAAVKTPVPDMLQLQTAVPALAPDGPPDAPDVSAPPKYSATDAATKAAMRIATEGITPSEAIEGAIALPPMKLKASTERHSFDLQGPVRGIMEEVARTFGIHLQFELNYQAPQQPVRFEVQDLNQTDALRILEAVANSFFVPLNDHEAMVFRDTQQNRAANAPLMSISIPIPDRMSVQEAQDIAAGIQQTLEIRRIAVDAGRRTIFLRDQESKVIAARKVISDLARPKAEIHIGIELLSVVESSSLSYGLSLPTSIPIVNFSSLFRNIPSTIAGVANMATFGGGSTFLGLGIADAAALATVSRSESESVLRSEIAGQDGQQITMHIGDRYPVVTASYSSVDGQSSVPTFTYLDLGLKLTVTPTIHRGDVTMAVEAQYDVLGPTDPNGIPQVSSRKYTGTVRVKDGEWAVLAGLTTVNAGETKGGIPFLSNIPLIGRLFRNNTKSKDKSEVLIVLKPQVVSDPPWERATSTIRTGTESTPASVF